MTDVIEAPIEENPPAPIEENVEEKPREARLDPSQQLDWGDVSIAGVTKEEPEEEPEEEVEAPMPEEPVVAPQPAIVSVADPGTYTPADYSFEYEIEGKKFTISKSDDIDSIPNEDLEKLKASEITSLLRKGTAIDSKLERDKEAFDKRKEDFDAQQSVIKEQEDTANNIGAEFAYMVSKGMIPDVTDPAAKQRWQTDGTAYLDEEFIKTPGIKEQVELINALAKENKTREKAGLRPTQSVLDIYSSWQLEARNKEESDKKTRAAAARNAAGARIAGSSPNPVNIAPKGIAVGRAMNLTDLESF